MVVHLQPIDDVWAEPLLAQTTPKRGVVSEPQKTSKIHSHNWCHIHPKHIHPDVIPYRGKLIPQPAMPTFAQAVQQAQAAQGKAPLMRSTSTEDVEVEMSQSQSMGAGLVDAGAKWTKLSNKIMFYTHSIYILYIYIIYVH